MTHSDLNYKSVNVPRAEFQAAFFLEQRVVETSFG